MFFTFHTPDQDSEEPKKEKAAPELNSAGEPKYLRTPNEKGIVINIPELLLKKEVSKEPPDQEDLNRTSVFLGPLQGWVPFDTYVATTSPSQQP